VKPVEAHKIDVVQNIMYTDTNFLRHIIDKIIEIGARIIKVLQK